MITPQIEDEALKLFVELLKIDTTNPPGNERLAAEHLADNLRQDGYEPQLFETSPGRANLVVRRKGDGTGGGPLLLSGHLDVVPAHAEGWKHPPFGGVIEDGWLWGRGAVDMKNHVAASAMMMKLLARLDVKLKRDVIFCAVADEEAGCRFGAQWMVDNAPEAVRAEYALGELGGFTLRVGNKRLYPIQIAHKGVAWLTMKAKGTPGHGSMPRKDTALMKLSRAILRIGNMPLPVHPIEPTRQMLTAMGEAAGFPGSLILSMLLRPALSDYLLEAFIKEPQIQRAFNSALRNTVSPTMLSGGSAPNVIPPQVEAKLDGRLLPGQTAQDLIRELKEVVDDPDVSFEIFHELDAVQSKADTPMFRQIAQSIRVMDPDGIAVPNIIPGFTDATAFHKLGTTWYGFAPIFFPETPKVAFTDLYHGHNERIPVDGFKKGLHALWDVVAKFCG